MAISLGQTLHLLATMPLRIEAEFNVDCVAASCAHESQLRTIRARPDPKEVKADVCGVSVSRQSVELEGEGLVNTGRREVILPVSYLSYRLLEVLRDLAEAISHFEINSDRYELAKQSDCFVYPRNRATVESCGNSDFRLCCETVEQ
jgi:hypothetical protein